MPAIVSHTNQLIMKLNSAKWFQNEFKTHRISLYYVIKHQAIGYMSRNI